MEDLKFIEESEIDYVEMPHNIWKNYWAELDSPCDGQVYWEPGMEGYVCTKCELYTGIK